MTVGRTLSQYVVLEKLGEGGMGAVYKARDTRLNRIVALKALQVAGTERNRRFALEAQAASALNHPNIVTIYEMATYEGVDLIAMEFVRGQPLDVVIGGKPMRVRELLNYGLQIADALAVAHAAGIIHRDIKPSNIMVTAQGLVKILDFGLVKLVEPASEAGDVDGITQTLGSHPSMRTEEGTLLGTVAYMSPEQAEGRKIDARSDIFSFGSVLYEMATGRRAFQGSSKISTLSAILREDPQPPSQISGELPRELERIIGHCLEKDPARRFQHMSDLKLALADLREDSESLQKSGFHARSPASRRRRILWTVAPIVVTAALAAAWWGLRSRPARPTAGPFTRITSTSGLNSNPTVSPDGKLIAYASARDPEHDIDIWVQQVGNEDALQLTRNPADDYGPAISPDSRKILFRSERDPPGIYMVSTLGGAETLIAAHGRDARFSPDGKWIAYSSGDPNSETGNQIFVIPADGGERRQLAPSFLDAHRPVWCPGSACVLFEGTRSAGEPHDERVEWWVAPLNGGQPVKTGAARLFNDQKLEFGVPGVWSRKNTIFFSARAGDTQNLWIVAIAPRTFQIRDKPEQITFGTGNEVEPALADTGLLVFSSRERRTPLWALPLDAGGAVAGEGERVSQSALRCIQPSLSADGERLAFLAVNTADKGSIWVRDGSGKESPAGSRSVQKNFPRLSPSGKLLAYSTVEDERSSLGIIAVGGGFARTLCDNCGFPEDWTGDERNLLIRSRTARSFALLDIASAELTEVLRSPDLNVFAASLSPDDRWVAFHTRRAREKRRVFVAPIQEGRVAEPGQWMPVTDGSAHDMMPRWRQDGSLLYFASERDGFRCIWAQRLDPQTRRNSGQPFAVYHSHARQRSLINLPVGEFGFDVSARKLVLSVGETSGAIWMTQLSP